MARKAKAKESDVVNLIYLSKLYNKEIYFIILPSYFLIVLINNRNVIVVKM